MSIEEEAKSRMKWISHKGKDILFEDYTKVSYKIFPDLIIAINPDENSPICEQCDIFIKGHMEEILPKLIEIIKNHSKMLEIQV